MERLNALYSANLRNTQFVFNVTPGVTAIPDRDEYGIIPIYWRVPSKYVIIQHVAEEEYLCSCDEFSYHESCYHIQAAREFLSRIDIVNERLLYRDSQYAFQGQHQPGKLSAVYCDQDKTFGVIRKTPKLTHCLSCCTRECCHVDTYLALNHADYHHIPQEFPSITKHDIAYPLSGTPPFLLAPACLFSIAGAIVSV